MLAAVKEERRFKIEDIAEEVDPEKFVTEEIAKRVAAEKEVFQLKEHCSCKCWRGWGGGVRASARARSRCPTQTSQLRLASSQGGWWKRVFRGDETFRER